MTDPLMPDCDRVSAARWAPPPAPKSLFEFACTITLVGGPLTGTKLNPRLERAVELWLRMLSSRKYKWSMIIAPSQRSKTLSGILIPCLHAMIERRVNTGWIMPNLDKLTQKWTGDIQPTLEAGDFGRYLPTSGPGSRNGRPAAMSIRDPETRHRMCSFYAMALGTGAHETSTASNPCAFLAIDEADDAESAGQLRLAIKRTASYGAAGGGVIATTINEKKGRELHPGLELYEDTTKTRLGHLCPHCQERVIPDLEHFNVERAAIACPACGVIWSEQDRHLARNAAEYVHTNPDAEVFGVLYTAIDYNWEYPDPETGKVDLLLVDLASEHRAALAAKNRGDPSQWANYLRKQWCRAPVDDDGEVPVTNDMHLAARAANADYVRPQKPNAPVLPPDVQVVTVGADTGKREAWWLGLAMADDLRWWVLDWSVKTTGDHRAEPTHADQRAMLDLLYDRVRNLGKANMMGVDVGYNTDLVTAWARGHGFVCVRGDARPFGKKDEARNRGLPSWAEDRQQDDGSHWLFLDVKEIKKEIHKALARKPGEPGAGHLPRGQEAGDWLIRHITSEVWDSEHGVWVKKPGRDNHLLDCLVYAWALAVIAVALNRQYRAAVVQAVQQRPSDPRTAPAPEPVRIRSPLAVDRAPPTRGMRSVSRRRFQ